MLKGYDDIIEAIRRHESRKISFEELCGRILSISAAIGHELHYPGDLQNVVDNWIEHILHSYNEENRHELGCSLGHFIQNAIMKEPHPLELPQDDRVVREQFGHLL